MRFYFSNLIILFLITGCSKTPFFEKNRKYHKTKKKYNVEILHIDHYVMQSIFSPGTIIENTVEDLNEDSVFNIFSSSLSNLDLSITYNGTLDNIADKKFHDNPYMKYKKIDINRILTMCNGKRDQLIMFPIISYINFYSKPFSISGSSNIVTFEKIYNTSLSISIFLIKNEEIIYFKSMFIKESHYMNEEITEHYRFSKDRWDELVRLVMLDYMERLQ